MIVGSYSVIMKVNKCRGRRRRGSEFHRRLPYYGPIVVVVIVARFCVDIMKEPKPQPKKLIPNIILILITTSSKKSCSMGVLGFGQDQIKNEQILKTNAIGNEKNVGKAEGVLAIETGDWRRWVYKLHFSRCALGIATTDLHAQRVDGSRRGSWV